MPAATATGARRKPPARARSARTGAAGAQGVPRVRWDRLGRAAMLCVLVALVYLYLSAGVHMLSTWRQSHHDSATVASMEREHRKLVGEHQTLGRQETIEADARKLGMRKSNEQPYDVPNLPDN